MRAVKASREETGETCPSRRPLHKVERTMEMKTTKQIMVHNVKRAPNYWGKIRIFCFTTGPDEGPTGAETPLVAMLKEALISFKLLPDKKSKMRSQT